MCLVRDATRQTRLAILPQEGCLYLFNKQPKRNCEEALTLIEVLVVATIISILVMIVSPLAIGRIERAREEVCAATRAQVTRMYEVYLLHDDRSHSDFGFYQFIQEDVNFKCPSGGIFSYSDGIVACSAHPDDKNDGDGVPFLWNHGKECRVIEWLFRREYAYAIYSG